MLVGKFQEVKWAVTKPCYTGEKTAEELNELIREKFHEIAAYLETTGGLLLGNWNVCYMDFYLYEMVLLVEFVTSEQIFEWYPILREYKGQMA